jgi:hypothetical protein
MRIKSNKDKLRADEVVEITWTWWPEDVLDALDLLLVYSGRREKLTRPGVPFIFLTGTAIGRRCIHPKAFKAAYLLCHFNLRAVDGRAHWLIKPGEDTDGRLRHFGINPQTLEIEDPKRFNITWHLLTKDGFYVKLYSAEFNKLYSQGHPGRIGPMVEVTMKDKFRKRKGRRAELEARGRNGCELTPAGTLKESEPENPGSIGAMLHK